MAIIRVVWAGIKKRKTYSVAIIVLVLMMTVLLSGSISLIERANKIYNEIYTETASNHIQYFFHPFYEEQVRGFGDWFIRDSRIQKVERTNILKLDDQAYSFLGQEPSEHLVYLYPNNKKLMTLDKHMVDVDLEKDQVVLPIYYKVKYNLKKGDIFAIYINGQQVPLRIHSFYVDPVHGSAMITVKTAVIHEETLQDLINRLDSVEGEGAHVAKRVFMGIQVKEAYAQDIRGLNKDFYANNKVPINVSYTKTLYEAGSLQMPNMILTIIIGCAILLLLIIVLVIRNAIHSAIETDYVNIGILKGLGFTGGQIRLVVFMQFSILGIVGILCSMAISPVLLPYVGKRVFENAGIIWYGSPSVVTSLLILLSLLMLINLVVYIASHRATRISPIEAISGGKSDIYFGNYVNIPLKKLALLPLNLRLGVKQLLTRVSQYMMLLVITAVLIMITGIELMSYNVFNDLDVAYRIFGLNKVDIEVNGPDEGTVARILEEVTKTYDAPYSNLKKFRNLTIDSESILGLVWADFDRFSFDPLEGRFPRYENEITITRNLAKYYDKKIGDTLYISDASGEQELAYIITGYHQYISNLGKNVFLTTDGLKRIDSQVKLDTGEITLPKGTDVAQVLAELEARYENKAEGIDIFRMDYAYSTVTLMKSILSGIVIGNILLVIIITSVITMLQASIVVHKENKELGIYKAMGYVPLQLRLQFAARFGAVTCVGGIVGCILCRLFCDDLLEIMLVSIGVSKFGVEASLIHEVASVGLITVVAYLIAFVVAGRIKRVSSRVLITE